MNKKQFAVSQGGGRSARFVATGVLTAASLMGCGSPLVRWDPPPSQPSPVTFEYAKQYAQNAKAAYQGAIYRQTEDSTHLNTGLFGLGVVATGLAISTGVHQDAIVGTALTAGSTYVYGKMNLDPRNVQIYMRGIEAINCANRAIAPLATSNAESEALRDALARLRESISEVGKNKFAATQAFQLWAVGKKATDPGMAEARTALDAAQAALDTGRKVWEDGLQLQGKTVHAGDRLVEAVDSIHTAVIKAILDSLPDSDAIMKVIPGIAGYAGSFVPGTDAFITDRLSVTNAALQKKLANGAPMSVTEGVLSGTEGVLPNQPRSKKKQADNELLIQLQDRTRGLSDAMMELDGAVTALALATTEVTGLLNAHAILAGSDPLKDCGVTDIALPLKTSTREITLPKGADINSSFSISGGQPLYTAELQSWPVKGVSVRRLHPTDSGVLVSVTKEAAPGDYPVKVTDSAKPPNETTVVIRVADK